MGKIFYYCLKKISDKNEAEELTQEITLNVISSLNIFGKSQDDLSMKSLWILRNKNSDNIQINSENLRVLWWSEIKNSWTMIFEDKTQSIQKLML